MTRVLLLDDSLTIHKVVRLTFASTPGYEVDVAKNEAEARSFLERSAPDVVVGYARFAQERTPQFFEEIRSRCPHVLVLTESDENTGAFERAGFRRFLKKPFHSDELRKAVAEFVGAPDFTEDTGEFGGSEFSSAHDEPTHAVKPGTRAATPPPPPLTVRAGQPPRPPGPLPGRTQITAQRPATDGSISSGPSSRPAKTATVSRIEDAGDPFAAPRSSAPAMASAANAVPAPIFAATKSAAAGIPRVTMDVESLERSYRATLTQRPAREEPETEPAPSVRSEAPAAAPLDLGGFSAPFSLGEFSLPAGTSPRPEEQTDLFGSNEPTLTFVPGFEQASRGPTPSNETNPFMGLFDAAARRGPSSPVREIDLGPAPSGPLELEDVVVNAPPRSALPGGAPVRSAKPPDFPSAMEQSDVQAAIDDALMRALERAVPAKIESKLESEWQRLAGDIASRIKPEVARDVQNELAGTLRGVLEAEVRREMRGWIQREAVTLAKEVVREEIRRLIEEG